MTPNLTSAALGILLALGIFWLVRRDQLHGSFALWWLLLAATSLLLGFFPGLVDWVGAQLGVAYPPMLLALLAIAVMLLKMLGMDIEATRREIRLRRLIQKIGLLELELTHLKSGEPARTASPSPPAATDAGSDPTPPAA